jgi:hypothetical protein
MYIRKIISFVSSGTGYILLALGVWVLINSSLDIYNNFAYEKAILKDSPYGGTPLLINPKDYSSADGFIKCGDFVYVEDWLSAGNGNIVFAKVKSKLKEGYINKELLVPANINVKPIISILLLFVIFTLTFRKFYYKFLNKNIVFIKD